MDKLFYIPILPPEKRTALYVAEKGALNHFLPVDKPVFLPRRFPHSFYARLYLG